MTVRLRPYRMDDESAACAAHEILKSDHFEFLLGWRDGDQWSDFLRQLSGWRRGLQLPGDYVPSVQLVAEAQGALIGRASIRFALNDYLASRGGHIGFAVLPAFRRRGYATEILRQSLVIARSEGVARALLTCDDDNVGSRRCIERCGGVLESVVTPAEGGAFHRYWLS